MIRPVITIWCLPTLTEEELGKLHQKIVKTVEDLQIPGLKGENSMIVLFPRDMMAYGLGSEIYIEINGYPLVQHEDKLRSSIAPTLGSLFKKSFPEAHVQCIIHRFDDIRKHAPNVFVWSSDDAGG